MKGWPNITALADLAKHLLEHRRALFLLGRARHIEIVQLVKIGELFAVKRLVIAGIDLAAM